MASQHFLETRLLPHIHSTAFWVIKMQIRLKAKHGLSSSVGLIHSEILRALAGRGGPRAGPSGRELRSTQLRKRGASLDHQAFPGHLSSRKVHVPNGVVCGSPPCRATED